MITTHFEFSVRTVIHSGMGSITLLPELLKGLGGKRVVLYSDKGLTNAGITKKIIDLFEGLPVPVQLVGVFDEIEQDAKGEIINRGAQFYNNCHADSLIALGGGSVLDTVKAIKWKLHKGLSDIRDDLQVGSKSYNLPEAQLIPIPHIAIATTAGTGAEVSPGAVIYNENLGIKTMFAHPFINADIAILDPELTVGLPPKITAFTGMDALTHAIEAYFSNRSNPISDAFAIQSIKLILNNLQTAVHEGENLASRGSMLMASSMAIVPFFQALNAIPVHNIAHAIGAKFGIPHGLANAVLLPNVMESLAPLYLPRIHEFANVIGLTNPPQDGVECLAEVVQFIRDFRNKVGLPSTFSEFDINKDEMKNIIAEVHRDPAGVFFRIPDPVITKVINEVFELSTSKV